MQLHFTGRNIDVTPALKKFATEKMDKLERLNSAIHSINITFHVENVTHTAEATAHLDGAEIHASAKAADMYIAIDELIDKLVSQIKKHKEKHSGH